MAAAAAILVAAGAGCGGDPPQAQEGSPAGTAPAAAGNEDAIRAALFERLEEDGWRVDGEAVATRTVEGLDCRARILTSVDDVRRSTRSGEDVAIDRLARVGAVVTDQPRPCIRALDLVIAGFDVERVPDGGTEP